MDEMDFNFVDVSKQSEADGNDDDDDRDHFDESNAMAVDPLSGTDNPLSNENPEIKGEYDNELILKCEPIDYDNEDVEDARDESQSNDGTAILPGNEDSRSSIQSSVENCLEMAVKNSLDVEKSENHAGENVSSISKACIMMGNQLIHVIPDKPASTACKIMPNMFENADEYSKFVSKASNQSSPVLRQAQTKIQLGRSCKSSRLTIQKAKIFSKKVETSISQPQPTSLSPNLQTAASSNQTITELHQSLKSSNKLIVLPNPVSLNQASRGLAHTSGLISDRSLDISNINNSIQLTRPQSTATTSISISLTNNPTKKLILVPIETLGQVQNIVTTQESQKQTNKSSASNLCTIQKSVNFGVNHSLNKMGFLSLHKNGRILLNDSKSRTANNELLKLDGQLQSAGESPISSNLMTNQVSTLGQNSRNVISGCGQVTQNTDKLVPVVGTNNCMGFPTSSLKSKEINSTSVLQSQEMNSTSVLQSQKPNSTYVLESQNQLQITKPTSTSVLKSHIYNSISEMKLQNPNSNSVLQSQKSNSTVLQSQKPNCTSLQELQNSNSTSVLLSQKLNSTSVLEFMNSNSTLALHLQKSNSSCEPMLCTEVNSSRYKRPNILRKIPAKKPVIPYTEPVTVTSTSHLYTTFISFPEPGTATTVTPTSYSYRTSVTPTSYSYTTVTPSTETVTPTTNLTLISYSCTKPATLYKTPVTRTKLNVGTRTVSRFETDSTNNSLLPAERLSFISGESNNSLKVPQSNSKSDQSKQQTSLVDSPKSQTPLISLEDCSKPVEESTLVKPCDVDSSAQSNSPTVDALLCCDLEKEIQSKEGNQSPKPVISFVSGGLDALESMHVEDQKLMLALTTFIDQDGDDVVRGRGKLSDLEFGDEVDKSCEILDKNIFGTESTFDTVCGDDAMNEDCTMNGDGAMNENGLMNEDGAMNEDSTMNEDDANNEDCTMNGDGAMNEDHVMKEDSTINEDDANNEYSTMNEDCAMNEDSTMNEDDANYKDMQFLEPGDGVDPLTDTNAIMLEPQVFFKDNEEKEGNKIKKDGKEPVDESSRMCPICNLLVNNVEDHIKAKHHFVCGTCGKAFNIKSNLIIHLAVHSEKRDFECKLCSKSFKTRAGLVLHERSHNVKKRPTCQHCKRTFLSSSQLHEHLQKQHADVANTYVCDTCGKEFWVKRLWMTHRNRHLVKGILCMVCGRRFSTDDELEKHASVHTKQNSVHEFCCDICGRTFRELHYLNAHRQAHERRQYDCEKCRKSFKSETELEKHFTSKHRYKCGKCGEHFEDGRLLIKHRKNHL